MRARGNRLSVRTVAMAALAPLSLLLASPLGAQRAPADPLPAGMSVVDLGVFIRPATGSFVSADVLRALAGPAPAPRTYDLTEHERFASDVLAFLAARPPAPRAVTPRHRTGPEVTAEYAAIRKAYNACPGDPDDDYDDAGRICRLKAKAIDYDNSLADPLTESVPREKARHSRPLTPAARQLLERRLNEIMTVLRTRMQQDRRGRPGAAAIRPVRVVIDPALGLNIQSSFGGTTIRVDEEVVTDIYFRALHRAINSRRIDAVRNNLYEDCNDCDRATTESGVYALNFDRLAFASRKLPAFRLRAVSTHWLGRAILTSCTQYPQRERTELSQHLLEGGDVDLRHVMDGDSISKYLPCATDGRARIAPGQTEIYVTEMEDAEELDMDLMTDSYMPLFMELARTNTQVSAELLKSYLFLLAHESYHLWVSDSVLQNVEFAADAHAGRLYLQVYKQIDPGAWLKAMKIPQELGGGDIGAEQMMQDVLGRDPVNLLREVYSGTAYYDGNWSHPPVATRSARLKTLIESGRQAELCKLLTEMTAAPGGPAADELDLSACRRRNP